MIYTCNYCQKEMRAIKFSTNDVFIAYECLNHNYIIKYYSQIFGENIPNRVDFYMVSFSVHYPGTDEMDFSCSFSEYNLFTLYYKNQIIDLPIDSFSLHSDDIVKR